jgi:thymidylate synthase ThyX
MNKQKNIEHNNQGMNQILIKRRIIMSLSTKELFLVKDNVKLGQNSWSFMTACTEITADPQVRELCNSLLQEHERDVNTLIKHIVNNSVQ